MTDEPEGILHERGRPGRAVAAISEAIHRRQVGLRTRAAPMAHSCSGPTGVHERQKLSKALSEAMFGTENITAWIY